MTSHPRSFDLMTGIDSLSFQRSPYPARCGRRDRAAYISRFFRQWAEMGSSNDNLRSFLAGLFRIAVSAAHPATCLPPLLPPLPSGRLILLAAGKAAGSMAETAEAHYLDRMRIAAERLTGVAVARHGYARHLRKVRMIEAGHPIPDAAGLEAAERALVWLRAQARTISSWC